MKNIKKFLRTNAITANLYRKLYSLAHKKEKEEKRKAVRENGVKTLFFLQDILSKENVMFYFDMGTLLGLIREGHLLSHDMDIDIAVYTDEPDRIRKKLLQSGCNLKYSYFIDGLGDVEDSFIVNNIKFDIEYYRRIGEEDICYLMYRELDKEYRDETFSVVELHCKAINRIEHCLALKKPLNIPCEAVFYLEQRYGKDWKIPDTSYVYWKGPSTRKTEYIGKRKVY